MEKLDPPASPRAFNLRLVQPDYWNKPDPAQDVRWSQPASAASVSAPSFWLLDGPPYANGELHLGHVLNKCLKDAFARHRRALGRSPLWRAGWDCHGLPLELATQKRPGAPDRRAPAFLSACREEARHWMVRQAQSFERLGTLADTKTPWTTMDPGREASAMRMLFELWESGLLVERHTPTHWCPACGSALAASELETTHSTKDSLLAWAGFDENSLKTLLNSAGLGAEPAGLVYWTTTPWTVPANVAFAMPQDAQSVLVRLPDGRLALLGSLSVPRVQKTLGAVLPELARFGNNVLDALKLRARSPVGGSDVPVRQAPFAKADEGSGFVHVAPAFGPEDFEWAEARPDLELSLNCPMARDGKYDDASGAFAGLDRERARELALELLSGRGDALSHFSESGEAQACWRHGAPVFYRASRQWALDLDKPFSGAPAGLRGRASASLDAMKFLSSDKAKNALSKMLEGRRFWSLSRDRPWGLPLPFLRGSNGTLSPLTRDWWLSALQAVESGGIEAYARMTPPEGLLKEGQCVDVWFDSGAAFETAAEAGFDRPDLVVEGADQTRGWFLSSMLLGAFRSAEPVFKSLACHGFVVDEKGRKLSKSLGNAPDTNKLFEEHGADALRLWSLSQTMGQDVVWSKKSFEHAKGELRDWRNFLRFLLAHAAPGPDTDSSDLTHLALRKAAEAREGWLDGFERGQPHAALAALAAFRRWASSSWFELSKRALYCQADGRRLAERKASLWLVLRLFAPMLSAFMSLSVEQALAVLSTSDPSWKHLPDDHQFDSAAACRAESSLAWREEMHKKIEAERTRCGDPKARFLSRGPKSEPASKSLGVGREHLVRGLSFVSLSEEQPWMARNGWECPRCRGLFSSMEQAAPSVEVNERVRAAFHAELCLECVEDENMV